MADVKISQLPAAASIASTDVAPVVTGGVTSKVTAQAIVNGGLSGGTANGVLYLNGSKAVTSGSALTFDGTNLGIGVTPSAWSTAASRRAIQLGFAGGGAVYTSGSGSTQSAFVHGAYNDGTNWVYAGTSIGASRYELTGANGGSTHSWYVSTGGTAGNTISFTQAMTLDASGNLVIGGTTSSQRLTVIGGSIGLDNNRGLRINDNAGVGESVLTVTSGNNLAISSPTASGSIQYTARNSAGFHQFFIGATQAMTLDASGNLVIGATSASARLHVSDTTSASATALVRLIGQNGYQYNIQSLTSSDSTVGALLGINVSSSSGEFSWSNSVSEKMRLDKAGNLGIGTTANASAILDAQSTTKGVRFPNMTTTQKNAIASPAAGLVVFDTTLAKLCLYTGAAWQTITSV